MRSLLTFLPIFIAILAIYNSQPKLSLCFSVPLTPFRNFIFAENGVCLRPKIFYCVDGDEEEEEGSVMLPDIDGAKKRLKERRKTFSMRNVPGEGDCIFQAVALATATSMGLGGNYALLRAIAVETRDVVAQVLNSDGNFHIEKKRFVKASDLLKSAARGEGLTPQAYLRRLKKSGEKGGLYGGGPELTVLSNVLRRPISIYELDEPDEQKDLHGIVGDECRIKLEGVFGDMFKDPCLAIPDSAVLSGLQPGAYSWHLHILIVDAGRNEKHACALLPNFCDSP